MTERSSGMDVQTNDLSSDGEALRLAGIDKRYGGVHALKNVDFSVRWGEVHGIVGENGAGKSTLVGVAAGTVVPDNGIVKIAGVVSQQQQITATWAKDNGVAVVYQEPALIPDLTVAENMRLGAPRALQPKSRNQQGWAREHLEPWQEIFDIDPGAFVRDLGAGERFVVELARALAAQPKVLILDEPTEHLMLAAVDTLFAAIRKIVQRGCSVVYISHRVREVKRITDRITVLRDGESRGTYQAADVSETEIVDLIVGRKLGGRFPPKPHTTSDAVLLSVSDLSGSRFSHVDLTLRRGEIVGLGGIDGNGQRDFLRALAGLGSSTGSAAVNGKRVTLGSPAAAAQSGISYISNDRHREGMLTALSIADNIAIRAVGSLSDFGVLRNSKVANAVERSVTSFSIKIGSPDAPVETLSGGNQQKVMLARTMLTGPAVVLADEPSQGVDVGARAEVYGLLRKAAAGGAAVVLVSSDASELEGLCDRVMVFSRGQVVAELENDEVTERNITGAALTTTTKTRSTTQSHTLRERFRQIFNNDISPSMVLALVVVLLGIVASANNEFYLTARNFSLVLPFAGILVFFSLGQQLVMMTGGIDLSVGPLAGLISVAASFVLVPGIDAGGILVGLISLVAIALAVGVINWLLIDVFGIGAIIATLVTFTAIQGVGLILRPTPGGSFSPVLIDAITAKIGVVPVSLIVAVACAVILEFGLYRMVSGLRIRSTGSSSSIADKLGVNQQLVRLAAYLGCSLFALLGSVALLPQLGSGNAGGGTLYSLASITAVVLGGASIFGGRGSFVGAVLGSLLIVQVNTVVQFLGLTAYWQDWVLGALTIAAVAFYSTARAGGVRVK